MIPQPWLYTLLVVVGGFHVLAALSAYWFIQTSDNGVDSADGTEQSEESKNVECLECGTANERGYRYCANCVSELPGGGDIDRAPTQPVGRQIF